MNASRATPASTLVGRIVVGVVILALWELCSGRLFSDFWISRPSAIAHSLAQMATSGDLWWNLSATLQETLSGLAIGMVVGTLLGIVLAWSGRFSDWLYPYVMALYSLPKVALAPLFVVWFGIGIWSKILMVTSFVVFVAFYNVYEGVRGIDRDLLDMMKTYKASRMQVLTWVVFPAIAAWILTSLRLGIGLALIGSVIAELVGANRGMGYAITKAGNTLDTPGIFAGLFVIMVVAVVLEAAVVQIERRVLRYR
ncbi:MAG TPA: ABC transporter permease [Candidatus Limnocylindria bacterium]|nr:ABC transporter permease [Candidatus Limnocylindria bacterium]